MSTTSRRDFLRTSLTLAASATIAGPLSQLRLQASEYVGTKMEFGLCTFQWGEKWDLPTVLANCEKAGVFGVELRVQHKHGVDPKMDAKQRAEVKKRFADSPIKFVSIGTNQCYDSPDEKKLQQQIEGTKKFLQLSHDCGSLGIKVKPNDFHDGVSHEKTIEQIGKSLNTVGKVAGDLGQKIRLEVHGKCSAPPVMNQIMEQADSPHVKLCWNCHPTDVDGEGFEYNFNLLKKWLGDTTHIHEAAGKVFGMVYPFQQFIDLMVKADYAGWLLLEGLTKPKDGVEAMIREKANYQAMIAEGLKKAKA